ncbi:unnamed protein product [Lactuca virosa]|uniref:Uncharacterized protein n=1 Tax=Lactuca virosa TaxID=75947 RepID=A0AAU9PPR0_9ASTR|nr:unnamed protein product [Lactuca virosa]
MAPNVVLYTYARKPNSIKVVRTLDTPIVIMPNNVAIFPKIQKSFQNKGFEDFANYLTTCPLCYYLSDVVDPFFPQHVFEFYYTSTFSSPGVIVGTIGDGEYPISMSVTDDRITLRLPSQYEYFPFPSMDELHVVLEIFDYYFDA